MSDSNPSKLPDSEAQALASESQPRHGPETPPKGVRAMAIVRWVILALAVLVAVGSWWSFARSDTSSTSAAKYQCPMHPQIVSDHPGDCPICHMSLELVSADRLKPGSSPAAQLPHHHDHAGATEHHCGSQDAQQNVAPSQSGRQPAPAGSAPASSVVYTCPMHPEIVSDKPGSCPICKMDLEIRREPRSDGRETPGSTPDGTSAVQLTLDRIQSIGIRTTAAVEQRTVTSVRATAVVQAPEQNVAQVHVRTPGFVEGISVRETGVKVKRGQPLVSVYSPEIYQAQSELLATRDWGGLVPGADPAKRGEAARQKLELLGVGPGVADKALSSGKPLRNVSVSAPISGFVTRKNVVLGSYVTPEMVLYEIVDLSKVYVVADVFQQSLGKIEVGTRGSFRSASRGEATAEAAVDLIYPQVDLQARTTRVRMQVQNASLQLLPGEFGYVEFQSPARTALTIPRDAVVHTGRQVYAFVEKDAGVFSPRALQVGAESGDRVEVLAGLDKGDRVVSGATFLIDSESRLQASLAMTSAHP
ncbi:MAG TPA: efflux RND transporter periplasmic adaptor subunit [Polyangiaceae bacterium]|nr:efflux RND transporter periplasmic adaptor subunit [Polyangiaceae bacterium]